MLKKYSLDSCIPFIQNISHKNTIVVSDIKMFMERVRIFEEKLSELLVTDGCIYYNKSVLLLMGYW
ncbi:MAG: hypothetical protein ACLVIY_07365 [Anaerobutyricum soehngenii]